MPIESSPAPSNARFHNPILLWPYLVIGSLTIQPSYSGNKDCAPATAHLEQARRILLHRKLPLEPLFSQLDLLAINPHVPQNERARQLHYFLEGLGIPTRISPDGTFVRILPGDLPIEHIPESNGIPRNWPRVVRALERRGVTEVGIDVTATSTSSGYHDSKTGRIHLAPSTLLSTDVLGHELIHADYDHRPWKKTFTPLWVSPRNVTTAMDQLDGSYQWGFRSDEIDAHQLDLKEARRKLRKTRLDQLWDPTDRAELPYFRCQARILGFQRVLKEISEAEQSKPVNVGEIVPKYPHVVNAQVGPFNLAYISPQDPGTLTSVRQKIREAIKGGLEQQSLLQKEAVAYLEVAQSKIKQWHSSLNNKPTGLPVIGEGRYMFEVIRDLPEDQRPHFIDPKTGNRYQIEFVIEGRSRKVSMRFKGIQPSMHEHPNTEWLKRAASYELYFPNPPESYQLPDSPPASSPTPATIPSKKQTAQ